MLWIRIGFIADTDPVFGPPLWEASTLAKSYSDSEFIAMRNIYSTYEAATISYQFLSIISILTVVTAFLTFQLELVETEDGYLPASFLPPEDRKPDRNTHTSPHLPLCFLPSIRQSFYQCCGSGSTGSTCFWAPGSGSISQRYGSGSYYHHAK